MTTDPSSDVLERLDEGRRMFVLAAATLERDIPLHGLTEDEQNVLVGAVLNAADRKRDATIERLSAELERLKDHIFGHAEFAEYRIKDGDEMGARVWRIALEDIAKENRAALNNTAENG